MTLELRVPDDDTMGAHDRGRYICFEQTSHLPRVR